MGTNYYLITKGGNPCPTCGHVDPPPRKLHIGKSSMGWCFSMQADPLQQWRYHRDPSKLWGLTTWRAMFDGEGRRIEDEYGTPISPEEMVAIITDRESRSDEPWKDGWWVSPFLSNAYSCEEDFHRRSYSERGPNGLLRHRIDGEHCAGHGDGTWDLIVGEFS